MAMPDWEHGLIGVIGVGHLMQHMIEGWVRKGRGNILLSPRGAAVSVELSRRHGLEIARDNAEVVTRADVVFIATRPPDAPSALRGLPWREDQLVISVVSGQPLSALAANCAPADLVRSLPLISALVGASPTLLYPENPRAREILSDLGPVLVLAAETDFTAASVYGPAFSCLFALIDRMRALGEDCGVAPDLARSLAAQCMIGAGGLVMEQKDKPVAEIVAELATEGSFSKKMLGILEEKQAFEAWNAAFQVILDDLQSREA
jgi:pyrroline-5-carboxylate reductase